MHRPYKYVSYVVEEEHKPLLKMWQEMLFSEKESDFCDSSDDLQDSSSESWDDSDAYKKKEKRSKKLVVLCTNHLHNLILFVVQLNKL